MTVPEPPQWMLEQQLRDIAHRLEVMRRIKNGEMIKFNVNTHERNPMSKPTATPPAAEAPKKPSNRFRMDAMPPAYQSAGRIIQILTSLDLTDANLALGMVNQMFGERKQLADKPPFNPENGQ